MLDSPHTRTVVCLSPPYRTLRVAPLHLSRPPLLRPQGATPSSRFPPLSIPMSLPTRRTIAVSPGVRAQFSRCAGKCYRLGSLRGYMQGRASFTDSRWISPRRVESIACLQGRGFHCTRLPGFKELPFSDYARPPTDPRLPLLFPNPPLDKGFVPPDPNLTRPLNELVSIVDRSSGSQVVQRSLHTQGPPAPWRTTALSLHCSSGQCPSAFPLPDHVLPSSFLGELGQAVS
ncbi:hypothetical protein B0H13DRAFT_730447 [Mycena leptocephala]|nr:hypothetical protein B0H13DRAFT_730447 [Mycena leptocephala]